MTEVVIFCVMVKCSLVIFSVVLCVFLGIVFLIFCLSAVVFVFYFWEHMEIIPGSEAFIAMSSVPCMLKVIFAKILNDYKRCDAIHDLCDIIKIS